MKNSFLKIILTLILLLSFFNLAFADEFIFNITEIEITDNGNIYKGTKRGKITTSDEIEITSDNFNYLKKINRLKAYGNAQILDTKKNIKIDADVMFYLKSKEIIYTLGETLIKISDTYEIKGYDIKLLRNDMLFSSLKPAIIKDILNNTTYELNEFNYLISEEILKGKKISITTENNTDKSDKYFLDTGIFNFKDKKFLASDTNLIFHKTLFNDDKNDPRLKSVSSQGDEFNTYFDKGVFTSCKKTDKCPPWKITSEKIKHDKIKKKITYTNSWLSIYDIPVVYFPKFFHPDPSVKRQSGFLMPELSSSKDFGSSIYAPYFLAISENKDLTIKPRLYDSKLLVLQNEYRQKTKKSKTIIDFSIAKNFATHSADKSASRSHFFVNNNINLGLENFLKSNLEINFNKVSNDTYLKKFNLPSPLLTYGNSLLSNITMDLNHDNYDFMTSIEMYETLSGDNNNRYQYVLPRYEYSKNFGINDIYGSFNFNSNGSNSLNDTNVLTSTISNNLNFNSYNKFTENGIKSSFDILLKNLNSVGKKSTIYKSSPQSEIMSNYALNMSLPFQKKTNKSYKTLVPKISFRASPHDMKSHGSTDRIINANNIYNIDRLSLGDSFESGESITLGVDFKNQKVINSNIEEIEDYLDFKLATVFRFKDEKKIPSKSTLNRKRSNFFGQATYKPSDMFLLNYDFSITDDLNKFEYNSIDTTFKLNNFSHKFTFLEERGVVGNSNVISHESLLNFNEENSLSFKTRRNRTFGLTEYYDLLYEYKNDCLIAGVKYKKKYYEDRDIRPLEELFFSITIVPLTTFSPDKIILNKNRKD